MSRLIFLLCLFLLAFNQLAFAGVHVWAQTLSQVLIFSAAWLLAVGGLLRAVWTGQWPGRRHPGLVRTHPLLPFAGLFLLLAGLQLLPLDPDWVQSLSPKTWGMRQALVQAGILEEPGAFPLSLVPFTTTRLWLEHLSWLVFFDLVLSRLQTRGRVLALAMTLGGLALFQVVYGLLQTYSGTPMIWWWEKTAYQEWLTGTYINRNHLAGYLELAIPVCFGLGLIFWQQEGRRERSRDRSWKQTWLARLERSPALLFFSLGVFSGVGLLLSGSRGGVLCLSGAILAMGALFAVKRSLRGLGAWLVLLLVIIAVYGLQVEIEDTAERFEQTQGLTHRLELTARGTAMLEDYPLTGVGLGAFQRVFPQYEPETSSGRRHYRFAHNDWAQVGAELGLPGLLLVLAGYCLILIRFLRLWLQSRDPVAVNLGAGLFVGVMALGLHSFKLLQSFWLKNQPNNGSRHGQQRPVSRYNEGGSSFPISSSGFSNLWPGLLRPPNS